jgi:hypothetical protein
MTLSSTFELGAGFLDEGTGLWIEVHHPAERPDLWRQYLEGGERQYRKYGLEGIFGRDAIEDGAGVSLFFVGRNTDGEVVAGFRCHGPLEDASMCQALAEMADSVQAERLSREVASYIPYGVLETKGAWSALHGNHLSFKVIFRATAHALAWFRAEYSLGTMSDRFARDVVEAGGQVLGSQPAAFPNDHYRTILVLFRRSRISLLGAADEMRLVREERARLVQRAAPTEHAVGSWRPLVLDPASRADRETLQQLSRRPDVVMKDVAEAQRAELQRLVPAVGDDVLTEPCPTVYFPWRRTLVRMVGPMAFAALRFDRNRQKLSREEQARLRHLRIGVVGLSVGHAIAHALAMEGLCGELRLADFDTLETTNLNRLPATVLDLGENKAVLAARRIAELDPYLAVSVLTEGVQEDNAAGFVDGLDVLVEECDSLDTKLVVRELARARGIPVLMATSDRGLFDVERFDQEADRPLFHGLLGGLSPAELAGLSTTEKIPHLFSILEPGHISARGAASMLEIGETISTWPQLNTDVVLGAATAAAAIRRIGCGQPLPSGRLRIDVDELLTLATDPPTPAGPAMIEASPEPAPATGVRSLAAAASLAPSGGNVQPWCFVGRPDRLEILLAPERTDLMDVGHRGSYVAMGAAAFNARCAAASAGVLGPVEMADDERVPSVTVHLGHSADPALARLATVLEARCSNRRPGDRSPLEPRLRQRLVGAAAAEGSGLLLVEDRDALAACADLLADCDRVRFLTPRLHADLVHELRWPGRGSLDWGIDVRTLELDPAAMAGFDIVRRPDVMAELARLGLGDGLGDHTRDLVLSSSALAVVTCPRATVDAYLAAGQAAERVWLEVAAAGWWLHPVSPVFIYALDDEDRRQLAGDASEKVAALQRAFRETVGMDEGDNLALVGRVFRANPPSVRSRRLALDDLFEERPHRDKTPREQG